MQMLESVASSHSESAADSIADANKNGISWILTEWRVKIIRRPENGENLHITTWVREKGPASTIYRDYILTAANGAEVIRAEARIALFDLHTKSLIRVDEKRFPDYQPEEKVPYVKTITLGKLVLLCVPFPCNTQFIANGILFRF